MHDIRRMLSKTPNYYGDVLISSPSSHMGRSFVNRRRNLTPAPNIPTAEASDSSYIFWPYKEPTERKDFKKMVTYWFSGRIIIKSRLNGSGRTIGSQGGKKCQQQNKRQKVVRVCTDRPDNKNGYAGKFPLCNKCKLHHTGSCTVKYNNCKRVGYMTRDCRTPVITTTQGAPVAIRKLQSLAMSVERKGITRMSTRS
ncbi:hypothetical protein Tco_0730873 [Tanacetum coccineum]